MKWPRLRTLFLASQLVFIALAILLLLSFVSFVEGSLFAGWYSEVRTETKPPRVVGWHDFSAHKEYHGVFFREGVFAIGVLVEDDLWEQQSEWMPKTGLRLMGNVAWFPLTLTRSHWWNIFGFDRGRVDFNEIGKAFFVDPPAPGAYYSDRIRFNFGLVLAIEGVILAMAVISLRKKMLRSRSARCLTLQA